MSRRGIAWRAARSSSSSRSSDLEEFLQLHRGAHVALDLQLAGHVGARRVLLAADDLLERLLGGGDHRVGLLAALRHAHAAVVDADRPLARAVDVEEEG